MAVQTVIRWDNVHLIICVGAIAGTARVEGLID